MKPFNNVQLDQCSKFNESNNSQCSNVLNNLIIDHSLKLDTCQLSIKHIKGGVL